jgi:hypothetical protein
MLAPNVIVKSSLLDRCFAHNRICIYCDMAAEGPEQWNQKRWPLLPNGRQTRFRLNEHITPH